MILALVAGAACCLAELVTIAQTAADWREVRRRSAQANARAWQEFS